MTDEAGHSVLLYDGTCGFCAASVQFVLKHERRHSLKFAPLNGTFASEVIRRHPELAGVDSLIWVDLPSATRLEAVRVRSSAVLRAAEYIGGAWALLGAARVIPRALIDAGYDLFARHRHRIIRPPDECYLPPAHARGRFIE